MPSFDLTLEPAFTPTLNLQGEGGTLVLELATILRGEQGPAYPSEAAQAATEAARDAALAAQGDAETAQAASEAARDAAAASATAAAGSASTATTQAGIATTKAGEASASASSASASAGTADTKAAEAAASAASAANKADAMAADQRELLSGGWYGKTIVWLGTSVPNEPPYGEVGTLKYPEMVAAMTGARVQVRAYGGSIVTWNPGSAQYGLAGSAADFVAASHAQSSSEVAWDTALSGLWDADLFVFDHMHNDAGLLATLAASNGGVLPAITSGNEYDRTWAVGAMNYVIREIYRRNPRARIAIINDYRAEFYWNKTGNQMVADYWGLPIMNPRMAARNVDIVLAADVTYTQYDGTTDTLASGSTVNPLKFITKAAPDEPTPSGSDTIHLGRYGRILFAKQVVRWMRNELTPQAVAAAWSPLAMSPSLWLEPRVTGGYQDSAGTTALTQPGGGSADPPVGLVLDKSGNANNASQATSTARPVLSARKNLLLATATLSTQNVTTVAGQYTIQFSGAGSVTASGTYAGVLTSGQTFTATAGTLTLTVAGSVTSAQLEAGPTATGYQSVTNANTYDASAAPLYWKLDKVDDCLLVTVPPGGWTGTMIHSTIAGTISYAATLPAGSFAIGTNGVDYYYTPDNRLVGQIFVNSALSDSDAGKVKDYFVSRGGGPKDAGAYAGVTNFAFAWTVCSSMSGPFPLIDTSSGTNFSGAWGGCSSMTGPFPLIDTSNGTNFSFAWAECSSMSGPFPLIDTSNGTNFYAAWGACISMSGPFPLIDTSNGTNFSYAWFYCSSMTGPFPLIDTSNGTDFSFAWAYCSSLTSFPANMFDACPATNFTNAFVDCALNQTSIDNILVSIAAAGTSGGTLNMTGGTNATPSATGLAAKATLVGRGWTVTHN